MKILVYPQDKNPYQGLLYSNMQNCEAAYLPQPTASHTVNLLFIPLLLAKYRLRGFEIFHLHWLYNFRSPIHRLDNTLIRTLMTLYFCIVLATVKLMRYKLVWTIHNVIPHEKTFVFQDLTLRLLAKLCDLKIAHSAQTLDVMRMLKMSTTNTQVIPIGTYTNIYENGITREAARKRLGLKGDAFILLFIGMIKPYKGVTKLLETFTKLNLENTKLVVAGQCDNEMLTNEINKYKGNPNVLLKLGYIHDNEMQVYLNSCDVVALPFEQVTTSGSVLLAFSFSKTVIAPHIGSIRDIPNELGFFYDEVNNTLASSLLKAYKKNPTNLEKMGKEANNYVQELSWENIGNQTLLAFKSLTERSVR